MTVLHTSKLSWPRSIVLHLAPGAAATVLFIATAPVLARAGLPPVWGMFAAVLLVLVPSELAIIRRFAPDHRIRSIVDARWPAPRRFLLLFLPTLAAAILAPGLVQWLEPALHRSMQAVLPTWWDLDPGDLGARPAWQVTITLAGWLLCFVVIGPITEELYFRGFLLPRLASRPALAVPANAILFALYHGWQPYTWATVAIFVVPLAIVALRPRGVVVAATAHCTVNLIGLLIMLQTELGR
ncbi:MAG: CPBP family intramembrane metalloprotease [Micromonosporaceae bacterium]|nr:CPBP family intramembrane metalloprotease [Micromonosporaceae bacterium]